MSMSSIFQAVESILSRPFEQNAAHANEFIRILGRDIRMGLVPSAEELRANDLLARLLAHKATASEPRIDGAFFR